LTGNASEMQPLQGLIEMDPEQPIPAFILVDLPALQTLTIQFPEPLLCPPSPPIDSELPEVLHYDPTEDIAQASLQKQFVFMV
jgi:hypothetical protein